MLCDAPPAASDLDQGGKMDQQMSCGPDRSYNEGDETGQGEPMSQSPPQSSGRGSEGTNNMVCDAPPATSSLEMDEQMSWGLTGATVKGKRLAKGNL